MIESAIVFFENWHWEMNSTSKIGLDDRGLRYLLYSASGICIHIILARGKNNFNAHLRSSLQSLSFRISRLVILLSPSLFRD
jgi:hypothetical protein